MNKITTNSILALITLLVVIFVGKIVFIAEIDNQIMIASMDLESKRAELSKVKQQLAETATGTAKIEENILLNLGEEGQLMGLFINPNLRKHFNVTTYDLYDIYTYKPQDDLDSSMNQMQQQNSGFNSELANGSPENLVELDENGMPVNAYTNDEAEEWDGVKLMPIKVSFNATAKHFPTLLGYFQRFPVNTVRSADLICKGNKISGTMVFAFLLNEPVNIKR